ncbi:MAG: hypothetical protein KA956_07335 [Pyrinomonadaceae bacterium]|nr:gluconolaconase [Acidobacteriota bacterium]MBP7376274.1 hypothetical protein [Pyrinomonadaceae bacterium]
MNQAGRITAVDPPFAIAGGEIAIDCEGFHVTLGSGHGVYIGGVQCGITAASSSHILAKVPNDVAGEHTHLHLESGGAQSEPFDVVIGRRIADNMHLVANPAVDPNTDAIILTRSGGRGQQLPVTLFRLEPDGYLDELSEPILNPSGIAFDVEGRMFVTNRAEGEVFEVSPDGRATVYATGLGIATGIAFDAENLMYVGDRSGRIHRVRDSGDVEIFTVMEPSVAAYHMAFGIDGRLYVTAPGLASHDAIHVVDSEGFDEEFFRGFGRPQGLAFSRSGDLYIAACYKGRHGVVQVSADGKTAKHFVAGNNIVGLCFTRKGDLIVATGDSVYSVPCGIQGFLPDR